MIAPNIKMLRTSGDVIEKGEKFETYPCSN